MKLLASLAIVAVLSGCQTPPGSTPSAEVALNSQKAEFAAETGYNAFLQVISAGVDNGLIKGPSAVKAAALEQQANAALKLARAAAAVGDSAALQAQITALTSLVAQAKALAPAK